MTCKQLTVTLLGCLLTMAACGTDGKVTPPGDEPDVDPVDTRESILFAGDLSEARAVTRAALNDDGGPSSFKVWGFKNDAYDNATASYTGYQTVMDGYRVVFESGSGTTGWEYVARGEAGRDQMVKYWDFSARAYRYLAYAPAESTTASVTVGGNPVAATMVINADANDPDTTPFVSEMWFSNGNAVLYPDRLFGRTIQMRFLKPFARVRFLFTFSESAQHYDRSALSDISFAPLDGSKVGFKGAVTLTYPITGTETQMTFSSATAPGAAMPDVADALTVDYTTEHPHWYTVLPATQGVYRITVNVLGEVRTADVPAEMMQWKPGYEYTYRFKITETGGLILDLLEMAMHDWTVGAPRNHNFHNW